MNASSSFREIEFQSISKMKAGGGGGKLGDENEKQLELYLVRHYHSNGIINYAGYASVMTSINKENVSGEYDRVVAVQDGGTIVTPLTNDAVYEIYYTFYAEYEKVRRSESAEVNKTFLEKLQPPIEIVNRAKLIAESKSKASGLFINLFKKFESYSMNGEKELKNSLGKSFSPKLILDRAPITLMWFDGCVKLVSVEPEKKKSSYCIQRFGDGEVGPLENEMVYKNLKSITCHMAGIHLLKYFNRNTRHFPLEFYFEIKGDYMLIMSVHILKELHDFLEDVIEKIRTYSVIFVDSFKTTDPAYVQENPEELVKMIREESLHIFGGDYVPNCNMPFNYIKQDFINIAFNELLKEIQALSCNPYLCTMPSRHPTKTIEYFDKKLGKKVTKPGRIEPVKGEFSDSGKIVFLRAFIEQGSLESDVIFERQKINDIDAEESIIRYNPQDIEKILQTFEKIREYFELPEPFHEWLPTI